VDSEMGSRDVLGTRAETGKEVGFARVREYSGEICYDIVYSRLGIGYSHVPRSMNLFSKASPSKMTVSMLAIAGHVR
jgi:hypothetical protein